MKKLSLILLVSFLSSTVFAVGVSAKRERGESFRAAYLRQMTLKINFEMGPFQPQDEPLIASSTNVYSMRKPLKNLNIQQIPDLGSYADLENEFKFIRDDRFLTKNPNFPRRSTWLYPDDGCYARAELMKVRLQNHNLPSPKKIFVFGDLWVDSKNTPNNGVVWWYHVAVTYRIGNEAYVLDPAIEPQRPLKLAEWNHLMDGDKKRFEYSICEADAWDPNADCKNPSGMSLNGAINEQEEFLELEWERLVELNRNPQAELGEFPPWLLAH